MLCICTVTKCKSGVEDLSMPRLNYLVLFVENSITFIILLPLT